MSKNPSTLLWNLLLSAGLAASVFFELIWLSYVVIAFIWYMFLIYFYVLLRHAGDPELQGKKPKLPAYLGWTLDILNVSLMTIGGWYVTLVVYVASCLCAAQIYFRTSSSTDKNG